NITTNGIRTVHWDIVRHGNICGGEPVMGKAIKSVWKYRGQSSGKPALLSAVFICQMNPDA
ncbi:hypothetical protein N8S84_11300, partial [Enterobacter hormaechei subsp. hoffmannii]|nr:hypothetical protein [Enterobacter hormaechei subsp. hoffmannii]MCU3600935.1 hypothetical protein [Enterobacter hormaechei subsp. hoffmannii]